ncbi:hypothetical protein F5884DRAFT_228037 [Xylogone sp. PMI_703]|nr:hypothetical protein F5884DRAFT_228037 [Xylogone sp. PMI_703]
MLFGVFFAFWRLFQIVTLIPTLGMLAYFVHVYTSHNALTPTYILVLFIVSVLGAAWCMYTLLRYRHTRANAQFVALVDLLFVGALIAGVYELRFITDVNCSSVSRSSQLYVDLGVIGSLNLNGFRVNVNKDCAMLKASFAFGIMNIIFFFITSLMLWTLGRKYEEPVVVKETHSSRHSHRRSGSHRSHRSSGGHSARRSTYV